MSSNFRSAVFGVLIVFVHSIQAQIANHSYPRTGIFHWGAGRIESFAKYDLIFTRNHSRDFAAGIKKINPEAVVLSMRDFNGGMTFTDYPAEWYVRDSAGKILTIYGGGIRLLDYSDYCPRANYRGYTNIRYNEFVALYMKSLIDLSVYDGVATDGLWDTPWAPDASKDIDLDRNGINDNIEYGWSWVQSEWKKGAVKLIQNLRNEIGSDKIILINGTSLDGYRSLYNGLILEYGAAFSSNWYSGYGFYQNLIRDAPLRNPQMIYVDGCNAWDLSSTESTNVRNNFYLMRFILASTLLGNGYFGHQPQYRDHYMLSYYDEMDLDLGYPTSGNHTMKCVDGKCVYVRFFDKGVVILNVTGNNVTISDAEIRFPAYNGPYYFFEGGQDPSWNTGAQFSSITMKGSVSSNGRKYLGDALILVRTPQKVITEIIVDNYVNDTSPGSEPALFVGNWTQECGAGSWTSGCGTWLGQYPNAYSFSGSGENTATYSPKIGVSGVYEIYEWHGTPGTTTTVATNTPVKLTVDGNLIFNVTVDQTRNKTQWNSLGQYYLRKGDDVQITLSNKANGLVIADAFKFEYIGQQIDDIPPLSPTGLKLDEATERTILMSWQSPPAASDGDTIMFYEIFRNNNIVGISYKPTFKDENLAESTQYAYKIIGYDNSGNACVNPLTGSYSTIADLNGPRITDVMATGMYSVEVVFDEPVDPITAETATNYRIDQAVTVSLARLDETTKRVILTTSYHSPGQIYQLTVNNVKDLSVAGNVIEPNTQKAYEAVSEPIVITVAADNEYELFINGVFVGSGKVWYTGSRYEVLSTPGKNVIAIKGIDTGGVAGLVAEVEFMGRKYVSNDTWRVSTVEQQGWQNALFDDLSWSRATSWGLHGTAAPWASYQNVTNISTNDDVHWIWSSDWDNDNLVFFRFTLHTDAEQSRLSPPQGVQVRLEQ